MAQDPSQSSFGLQPNVAAGIASFFGVIGGLVILLGKPLQPWVRFVAVQSIVLFVAYIILEIALAVIMGMAGLIPGVRFALWGIIGILNMLLGLAVFIAWIIVTVKAFQGSAFRLPVIAQYADKWSAASTAL